MALEEMPPSRRICYSIGHNDICWVLLIMKVPDVEFKEGK
jgi:hypothetical protein